MVVKIGSNVLAPEGVGLSSRAVSRVAADVAALRERGAEVVLVSSGAIAAGMPVLGMTTRPKEIPAEQAAAATGQAKLMHAYEKAFARRGLLVAQVLLTHDDMGDRRRFLNAKNCLERLLAYGVVPIVNENDTVAVQEVKLGDNDVLSAMIANLIQPDLLVILSDVPGLYDKDPRAHADAKVLPLVERVDASIEALAAAKPGALGRGGIGSKIAAAKLASQKGIPTVVLLGTASKALQRLHAGEPIGTLFLPTGDRLTSRKHWIAHTLKSQGDLWLDAGAAEAVAKRGRSLLPAGVRRVEGAFDRGEMVSVRGAEGGEIARGLVDYSAEELRRIAGKKSGEIQAILGYKFGDEVIHRDDLVVL
ncbi:MAG: glutamate 5-kinase [Candidatus Methylomirabilis sp.]|nr:glutamate 5-kinase [Deltaproteobacteria bacterium]